MATNRKRSNYFVTRSRNLDTATKKAKIITNDDDGDDDKPNIVRTSSIISMTTTDNNNNNNNNNLISKNRLIDSSFWRKSTIELAKSLLGKCLCRRVDDTPQKLRGIIVETEAYLGAADHASYTFGGRRTAANEPMYMPAGTCFVRMIYGMYYCFNISSNDDGGAVLIRACEPIDGIETMHRFRRNSKSKPSKNDRFESKMSKLHTLANGPSKLCAAFAIDRGLNKANLLTDNRIWIENQENLENNLGITNNSSIISDRRIGIRVTNPWADKLLRFYLSDFKSVSKKKVNQIKESEV